MRADIAVRGFIPQGVATDKEITVCLSVRAKPPRTHLLAGSDERAVTPLHRVIPRYQNIDPARRDAITAPSARRTFEVEDLEPQVPVAGGLHIIIWAEGVFAEGRD